MNATRSLRIVTASLCAHLLCTSAVQAQATGAALYRQQERLVENLIDQIDAGSAERQLFSLWLADLLLTPAGGKNLAIGFEAAIGAGALSVLDTVARGNRPEAATAARVLRERIGAALDLQSAARTASRLLNATDSELLDKSAYGQWMTIAVESGVEYRIRSRDCAYLSAVAISADTETGIVGGTAFNGRFSFVAEQREDVLLRFRADECTGSGDISLSSGLPTLALRSGLAASTAAVVEVGRQYVGSFGPNNESWLRLGLQADQRYRLDVTPIGGVDTVITVYELDGATQIAYDDDGGGELASRVEISRGNESTVLVKISELDDGPGEFEFFAGERESAVSLATAAAVGGRYSGRLEVGGESWWRADLEANRYYVLDAIPASSNDSSSIDTVMTLYEIDGVTEIDSDDDGGVGFGSRLTVASEDSKSVLAKVHELGGVAGSFDFVIGERRSPLEVAFDARINRSQSDRLNEDGESWWRVDVEQGKRYAFEAIPADRLDTMMTLYGENGITELDSDDDGGNGFGSRIDYLAASSSTVLIRVHELSGEAGEFQFLVTERESPAQTATRARLGDSVNARLAENGETWWRFDADAGRSYVFEANPDSDIDTIMTLYAPDGFTMLDRNDDGGDSLGSRIEYTAIDSGTLLIHVSDYEGNAGRFIFSISEP